MSREAVTTASTSFDPELESLPKPRRPWRRLTLAVMAATAIASIWLTSTLIGTAGYALAPHGPADVGRLTDVQLGPRLANRWVKGRGFVGSEAVEYRRPLVSDRFRVSPVAESEQLWVEVRVPEGLDIEHYVPPSSFVGRLVPLDSAGLPYSGVRAAIERATHRPVTSGTWLLIDGEAPTTVRWAVALVAMLVLFAGFSIGGIVHLLRPVRDP